MQHFLAYKFPVQVSSQKSFFFLLKLLFDPFFLFLSTSNCLTTEVFQQGSCSLKHVFFQNSNSSSKNTVKVLFHYRFDDFYCSQHVATVLVPLLPPKIEVTLSEGCEISPHFLSLSLTLSRLRNFSIDNLTSTSHKPRAVKTFVVRQKKAKKKEKPLKTTEENLFYISGEHFSKVKVEFSIKSHVI